MKIRYVIRLFWTTLLVGGIVTGIVGFIIRWNEFSPYFTDFNIGKILSTLLWLIGVGFIFSVISQMGFFAYITINQIGLAIFKSHKLWNSIQLLLIIVALFDVVYFRYKAFGGSIAPYIVDAIIILIVALIVAFFKVQQTNPSTFISSLFLMIVVTIIEWTTVLRVNEDSWIYLMLFPLLACNAYQLLILHRLNKQSQMDAKKSS